MWAAQLVRTGSLTISENGEFSDWKLYYPNTVPKPLEMLISFLRLPGSVFFHSLLTMTIAGLTLAAAQAAAGPSGKETALFLGFNPAFILLSLKGNPAIPFLLGMFMAQTAKAETSGAVIASLARPEGFIYGGWKGLKNWKLTALLFLSAAVWLTFHKVSCNSFNWASEEVRYSVSAMAYPTVNSFTLLPWAFLRSIMVLGAPGAALFYYGFKKWKLAAPFSLNFILLTISLAMGSLVLPRYIDQLFLLAAPLIFFELRKIYSGKALKMAICAILLFPAFQWTYTAEEISNSLSLREFYSRFQFPSQGITAANELLIPGMALAGGISNPGLYYVSTDRAAWEGATEAELKEMGVSKVVVVPFGIYYPEHTEQFIQSLTDTEVEYFQKHQ